MTFHKGREENETVLRQSTFTICSKHPFKVKAKLDSKSFRFPPTRLLLGLYDYRLKHLAVMKEEDRDVITTLQVDGLTVDVLPPIACHGVTQGSMFGLQRMRNSMVNARDS